MVLDRFYKPGRMHSSDDKGARQGAAGSAAAHVAELDVVLVALLVLELRELAEQQLQFAHVAVDPRARRPLPLDPQVQSHVPVPRRHAAVVGRVQPVLHPAQDHLPPASACQPSSNLLSAACGERGRWEGGPRGRRG
eukprot:2337414-Rhodomonas_salina.1